MKKLKKRLEKLHKEIVKNNNLYYKGKIDRGTYLANLQKVNMEILYVKEEIRKKERQFIKKIRRERAIYI